MLHTIQHEVQRTRKKLNEHLSFYKYTEDGKSLRAEEYWNVQLKRSVAPTQSIATQSVLLHAELPRELSIQALLLLYMGRYQ